MQQKLLNRLVWIVVSALITILISVTVSAQTDININDRNLIRVANHVREIL